MHHHATANHKSYHHYGGILIEFALSVPVLITLLFFVCDHYRYYEIQSKVRTSAYLAASMIQQVANTRTTKALTLKDIINVSYASCLNFFHTNTMFSPWKFNVFPVAYYFWVKRIDSSNYQYQSCYASGYYGTTPAGMNQHFDTVKTKKISDIQAMHPDLICDKDGDERVCIEYVYRFPPSPYDPKKLGFIIMRPSRSAKSIAGTDRSIFRYTIVITPKPGLFPIAN